MVYRRLLHGGGDGTDRQFAALVFKIEVLLGTGPVLVKRLALRRGYVHVRHAVRRRLELFAVPLHRRGWRGPGPLERERERNPRARAAGEGGQRRERVGILGHHGRNYKLCAGDLTSPGTPSFP